MNAALQVELRVGDQVEARIAACGHRATVLDLITLPFAGTRWIQVRTTTGQIATIPELDVQLRRAPVAAAS